MSEHTTDTVIVNKDETIRRLIAERDERVAAAVAAERERCAAICDEYSREAEKNADNSMAPECDIARSRAAEEIERRIREVPE